jgi:hypothetical protein
MMEPTRKERGGCVVGYVKMVYSFFFFFLHVHTREGGGRIRTCDLYFIKRGSQPIDLTLGAGLFYYVQ